MQVEFVGAMEFPFGLISAPLTYAAPTLETLLARVSQDLRDPDNRSFNVNELTSLITFAFSEVGRVYPKEAVEFIHMADGIRQYRLLVEDVWRVEVYSANGALNILSPTNGDTVADGWEFFAGVLYIPDWVGFTYDVDPLAGDYLRVWGYSQRLPPTALPDVCDVDLHAEVAIRLYAILQAYQRLTTDRGLFAQWASLPGNTDVSLTQLLGLAAEFGRQWDLQRKRLKTLRRV